MRRPGAAPLVLPLLLLLVAAFLIPLCITLLTAVRDPELTAALPRTAALLRAWDGEGLPDDAIFPVIGAELAAADRNQAIGAVLRRLNFVQPGFRTLLLRSARAGGADRPAMLARDARWGDPATWRVLRDAVGPWTDLYLLRALDLQRQPDGRIAPVEANQALYRAVFARTFGIALLVTGVTLALAYPVAASLVQAGGRWARLGVALVLMPLWISVLVRTTAWFLLLQREGPVNAALLALGLVDAPVQLMFTRLAVVVTQVHVLLPFAVLPLMAAMRAMDPALPRAALGLGAARWQMVWRIHLPLALPGVLAGGAIVFLLAVGFWVTPALVGGPGDQMVGSFVAAFTNETLNWGMAAALATWLLAGTAALMALAILPLRWLR